ncbi:TPA: LisH domain-containing protein armc9, variant 2 [Trebouxia sp. C0004]
MTSRPAIFRGICSCLSEFLQYEELNLTLEAFTAELAANRAHSTGLRYDRTKSEAQEAHAHLLEFHVQLYFAIFPALIGQSGRQGLMQTLPAFKQYLDASGSLLASDPNLLSYYALPYVRDPQSHPSFRHIFTPTFVSDLRQQISNAVQAVPFQQPVPRLYSMYAAAQAAAADTVPTARLQQHRQSPLCMSSDPMALSLSGGNHLQLPLRAGLGSDVASDAANRSKGHAAKCSSSGVFNGSRKGSSRPISALLNGSKELADLVSASKPRYADHIPAASLEPSAEVLHVVHSEAAESFSAEPNFLEDGNNASSLAIQPVIGPLRTISPDMATADTHAGNTYTVSTGARLVALAMPEPGLDFKPDDQGGDSQQSQSVRPVDVDSQHSGRVSGETAASQVAGMADSVAGNVMISSVVGRSSDVHLSAPSRVGTMSRLSSEHRSVSPVSDAAMETADDDQADKDDSAHDSVSQPSADTQTSSRRSSRIGSAREQPARSSESGEYAATAGVSNASASDMRRFAAESATSSAALAGTAGPAGVSPAAEQLKTDGTGGAVTGRGTTAATSNGNGTGLVMGTDLGRRSRGSSAGRASTSSSRVPEQDSAAASADFTGDAAVPAPTNNTAQPAAETPAGFIDRADSIRQDATARAGRQGISAHTAQNSNDGLTQSPEESQGLIGVDAEGSRGCVSPDHEDSQSPSQSPMGPSTQCIHDLAGLRPTAAADSPTKTEGSMVGASLSQLGKEGGAGVIRHSVILTSLDPLEQWLYTQPGMLPALDYDKIKTDLQSGDPGLAAALLQALRWRLDKAISATDQCQVLSGYIQCDILLLRQSSEGHPWTRHGAEALSKAASEQWACLLSVLAGMHTGRAYLCSAATMVVQQLCHWVQAAHDLHQSNDSQGKGLQGHALEALQRLTTRHQVRPIMVEQGVVRWLVGQLSHLDAIPVPTLECCGALLINLTLSKAGRHECEQLDVLVPLENLLEHESVRVQTYANASLYSLLQEPSIREAAREKGVDDFLHHVKQQASPVIGRQIDCVLQHWRDLDTGKAAAEQSTDQLDDLDDDPHDAHSHVGTGLDEAETVHSWDQLHGEKLLCCQYIQEGAPVAQPAEQVAEQTMRIGGISIKDLAAVLNPSTTHSLDIGDSQHVKGAGQMQEQDMPAARPKIANKPVNGSLSAMLPKLIPAAKQQEYTAAFGSQTKLPRTPLLSGYK